jgi:Ferric reductase like transmembrane component
MSAPAATVVQLLERSDRFRPLRRRIGGHRVADVVALLAALAPVLGVGGSLVLAAIGLLDRQQLAGAMLAVSEVPGVFILGAVLWCTPLTRMTGRSYRRQRKWFGLSFAFCATANLAGFLIEHPVADLDQDFAIIGIVAVVASAPLAATSTRRAIAWLGTRRWQRLHRLTYLIAAAVIAHLWIVPQDDGPGGNIVATVVFGLAAVVRIPKLGRWISRQRAELGGSILSLRLWLQRTALASPGSSSTGRHASVDRDS